MDNIHVVTETTPTVKNKPVILVLSWFGSISSKTRTKEKIMKKLASLL